MVVMYRCKRLRLNQWRSLNKFLTSKSQPASAGFFDKKWHRDEFLVHLFLSCSSAMLIYSKIMNTTQCKRLLPNELRDKIFRKIESSEGLREWSFFLISFLYLPIAVLGEMLGKMIHSIYLIYDWFHIYSTTKVGNWFWNNCYPRIISRVDSSNNFQ
jgi:hypothetical protein